MQRILFLTMLFLIAVPLLPAYSAYHHGTDTDSDVVLQAYPAIQGTKLDSCALCHTGGQYEKNGSTVSLGSCQWCHFSYGYDTKGNIDDTLNSYGVAYRTHGKNLGALEAIKGQDADNDGFTNAEEIAALRFPGNPQDDPTKVTAPSRVVSLQQLEDMEQHTQLMLMNTHKSGDYYTQYSGVSMADLLDDSGILQSATGITIFAPDGWAQYHPLDPDEDPLLYHVYGSYPQASFYYDAQADSSINMSDGWCDYSSPAVFTMQNGDPIFVEGGLQMILAYARDGEYLEPGFLTTGNKLDGEGPFRVVPPQKNPGPPDQSVKSTVQDVIWPFTEDADHNAGFATRSATMIKVGPLPEGTTEVDTLEAGWNFVDEGKVLIYGAIDPIDTVLLKINDLESLIGDIENVEFKNRLMQRILMYSVSLMERFLQYGHEKMVHQQLKSLSRRFDGCVDGDAPDRNDWLQGECSNQLAVYWALHEIDVLLNIEH